MPVPWRYQGNAVSRSRRPLTRVAVGVLVRGDGQVLLADRPAGKPYAGYWEFPGGKIEPGEPVAAALQRELHEELGIDIGPSTPWVTFEFDYPHAYVELQFRRVEQWRGEPHAREGQRLCFVDPAGHLPQPLLPAAIPALRWLRLPRVLILVDALSAATEVAFGGEPRIVAVQADWRDAAQRARAEAMRRAIAMRGLWFAAGPAAEQIAGWDGAIVEPTASPRSVQDVPSWRGKWADSLDDSRPACTQGCDFLLLRGKVPSVAERAPALPVFLPATTGDAARSEVGWGHGRWHDLRGSHAAPRVAVD